MFFFLIIRAQKLFLTLTDLDNHVVKKTKNVDKKKFQNTLKIQKNYFYRRALKRVWNWNYN